jgi:hypothetical protein
MLGFKYDDHVKAAEGGLCKQVSGAVFHHTMTRIGLVERQIATVEADLIRTEDLLTVLEDLEEIMDMLRGVINPTEVETLAIEDCQRAYGRYDKAALLNSRSLQENMLYRLEEHASGLYNMVGL